jgi:tyrosyl-tRNA synthetase
MCVSRSDAKRLLRSNAVCVDGEVVAEDYKISANLKSGEMLKLSCGKKKHLLILRDGSK